MNKKLDPSIDPFVALQRDFVKVTDRLMYLERQISNLTSTTLNLENALYRLMTKYEAGFVEFTRIAREIKRWRDGENMIG
jgi:hypothetical protein